MRSTRISGALLSLYRRRRGAAARLQRVALPGCGNGARRPLGTSSATWLVAVVRSLINNIPEFIELLGALLHVLRYLRSRLKGFTVSFQCCSSSLSASLLLRFCLVPPVRHAVAQPSLQLSRVANVCMLCLVARGAGVVRPGRRQQRTAMLVVCAVSSPGESTLRTGSRLQAAPKCIRSHPSPLHSSADSG